jgi:hypothetical protein
MGLIGNKPNQTPTNADLGTMAYEDADYFRGNTEIDTLGTVTTGDIKNSALARIYYNIQKHMALPVITGFPIM